MSSLFFTIKSQTKGGGGLLDIKAVFPKRKKAAGTNIKKKHFFSFLISTTNRVGYLYDLSVTERWDLGVLVEGDVFHEWHLVASGAESVEASGARGRLVEGLLPRAFEVNRRGQEHPGVGCQGC